jgi:group I intron endonuclease
LKARMYGVIYKITNTTNGHFYIGQTKMQLSSRWSKHKQDARAGKGWVLAAAIRKYGADAFTHEVIDSCADMDALNLAEIRYIETLKPQYNSCAGGGGLGSPTQAVRQKISAAMKGRLTSAGTRARMSAAQKGHFVSPETTAKIQAALKPRYLAMRNLRILKNGTAARVRMPRAYVSPLAGVYAAAGVTEKNAKIALAARLGYETGTRIRPIGEKNAMYGVPRSETTKALLSIENTGDGNPFYGRLHTEDTRDKMRKAHASRAPVTCPHCGKVGHVNAMKRWHFKNCRDQNGN